MLYPQECRETGTEGCAVQKDAQGYPTTTELARENEVADRQDMSTYAFPEFLNSLGHRR